MQSLTMVCPGNQIKLDIPKESEDLFLQLLRSIIVSLRYNYSLEDIIGAILLITEI